MGASGSAGAETSLSLQARLLGDSLCIDVMKAGTPEGLSESKGHWHITMMFQEGRFCVLGLQPGYCGCVS